MSDHWDTEKGLGTLTSKVFPSNRWDVNYSITFAVGFRAVPSTPQTLTKLMDVVHCIESVDERDIPSGEYDLARTVQGIVKTTRLRKTPSGWVTLSPDQP